MRAVARRVLVGVGEHKPWRRPPSKTDGETFKHIHHHTVTSDARGAKWDPKNKVWYVTDNMDLGPFKQWMPGPLNAPSGAGPSSDDGTPKRQRNK